MAGKTRPLQQLVRAANVVLGLATWTAAGLAVLLLLGLSVLNYYVLHWYFPAPELVAPATLHDVLTDAVEIMCLPLLVLSALAFAILFVFGEFLVLITEGYRLIAPLEETLDAAVELHDHELDDFAVESMQRHLSRGAHDAQHMLWASPLWLLIYYTLTQTLVWTHAVGPMYVEPPDTATWDSSMAEVAWSCLYQMIDFCSFGLVPTLVNYLPEGHVKDPLELAPHSIMPILAFLFRLYLEITVVSALVEALFHSQMRPSVNRLLIRRIRDR